MSVHQANTIVPLTATVLMSWVHISAFANLDLLAMVKFAKISMSVTMEAMTVTLRPIVQTPLDHSTAAVSLDTLEMDGTFAQITGKRSTSILSVLGQKMTTTELLISEKPVKSTLSNSYIQVAPLHATLIAHGPNGDAYGQNTEIIT